eukprot:2359968-Rhodomonas_salina.2
MGRAGDPEEIANVVSFLVSGELSATKLRAFRSPRADVACGPLRQSLLRPRSKHSRLGRKAAWLFPGIVSNLVLRILVV